MDASIHEGTPSSLFKELYWFIELVCKNDAEEICEFLIYDDLGEDSLEALEEANALITPIMNYIRECKGIPTFQNSSWWIERTEASGWAYAITRAESFKIVQIVCVGDISELG